MIPVVPGTTDTTGCTGIILSDLYLYSLCSRGYAVAVISKSIHRQKTDVR